MAKVIIGIHGLGNKPPKEILEKWWRNAIDEGLKSAGKPVPDFKFELVFWADVLYNNLLNENSNDKNDPLYIHEKYIPATGNFIPEDHSTRKKILDFLTRQLDTIFLNEDFTLNYSFITDSILQHYFKDLDIYYQEKCEVDSVYCDAKDIIRKRTAQIIRKYSSDEILIIGHSMGSIIAFDALSFDVQETKINTFITIGSPLGLPIVKSKIAAERKLNHLDLTRLTAPVSVQRHWYNFSDLEDKVAFNYRLYDDFYENQNRVKPIDFVVNNNYKIDGERNPHKSYGYLRTPEVAQKLLEFLEYQKPKIWKTWLNIIRNWIERTKLLSHINRNLRHR